MKQQGWKCEECGNSGVIEHEDDADVMAVVQLIEEDHEGRKQKPCPFDVWRVRVIDPQEVSANGGEHETT